MRRTSVFGLMMLLVIAGLLLTSCSSGGVPNRCAGWKPFTFADAQLEALRPTVFGSLTRDLLAHNKFGHSLGCW